MLIGRAALEVLHWAVVLNFIAEVIYASVMLGVDPQTQAAYGLQLALALAALLGYLGARRLLLRRLTPGRPPSSPQAA